MTDEIKNLAANGREIGLTRARAAYQAVNSNFLTEMP